MKYAFLLLIIFIFSLISVSPIYAQFTSPLAPSLSVTFTPENPGPNTEVTATAESFSTNINAAQVSWRVNGVSKSSGKGQKTFTFTTGNPGETTNVSVSVQTAEGESVNQSFSFKGSSVDVVWQVKTYTPPFFKGKALFSHQSIVTFIAIPHISASNGQEVNPKNLTYTWTKNGTVLGDFSGYGKNTYSMQGSVVSRPIEMKVEVTSGNGDVSVGKAVVTPIEPEISLYTKNPLYGIQFQTALTNQVTLPGKEMQVVAVPFFFSGLTNRGQNLSYSWSINGTPIDSDKTQTSRNFRPNDNTQGTSNISLSIENTQTVLQYAATSFNLIFNTKTQATNPSL